MVRIKQDLYQVKEDTSKTENIMPECVVKLSRSTSMKVSKSDRRDLSPSRVSRRSLQQPAKGSTGKQTHLPSIRTPYNKVNYGEDRVNDDLASITNVTPNRVKKLHLTRLSNEKYCINSMSSDEGELSPVTNQKTNHQLKTERSSSKKLSKLNASLDSINSPKRSKPSNKPAKSDNSDAENIITPSSKKRQRRPNRCLEEKDYNLDDSSDGELSDISTDVAESLPGRPTVDKSLGETLLTREVIGGIKRPDKKGETGALLKLDRLKVAGEILSPIKDSNVLKTSIKSHRTKPVHILCDKSLDDDSDDDTSTIIVKSRKSKSMCTNSKPVSTPTGNSKDLQLRALPKRSASKPKRYSQIWDSEGGNSSNSGSNSKLITKQSKHVKTNSSKTQIRSNSKKVQCRTTDNSDDCSDDHAKTPTSKTQVKSNTKKEQRGNADNSNCCSDDDSQRKRAGLRTLPKRSASKFVRYNPSSDDDISDASSNKRNDVNSSSRKSKTSTKTRVKSSAKKTLKYNSVENFDSDDSDDRFKITRKKSRKSVNRYRDENSDDTDDDGDSDFKSKRKISIRASLKRSAGKLSRVDGDSDGEAQRTPLKTPRSAATLDKTPKSSVPRVRMDLLTPSMPQRVGSVTQATTPLQKARERLHVSAVPKVLLCREAIFEKISLFLEGRILDKCGGSMYISGVPGTGKTATVRHVIAALQRRSDAGDLEAFSYAEVNGMRMTTPHQVYVQLLQALTGEKAPWEQAMRTLEKRFTGATRQKQTTIVLVDELDLICNRRQDVVYNLLDWPRKPSSRLVVLTIANTMDLPEKLLSAKVTSRMGLNRSVFKPYSSAELEAIVSARLAGIGAFEADAVRLVAKKVASISGDCRRALDICRRATEVAESEMLSRAEPGKSCDTPLKSTRTPIKSSHSPTKSSRTPTKSSSTMSPLKSCNTPLKSSRTPLKSSHSPSKSSSAMSPLHPPAAAPTVTMSHVQTVLEEMLSSHKITAIRGLSAVEQIFLRAVATSLEHNTDQTEFHRAYPTVRVLCGLEGVRLPTVTQLLRACQRLASVRMIICQKPQQDVRQKILLNCDADDIHWALTNIHSED